ncbi:hypothetical protein BGZ65_007584 [Modicella reniformis]|uniref:Glutamine amidotransferase domain-containing protein n=1 Tax=Modicella reniformis TaxID=1440133 RepID=A0A9P6MFR0_9FUNG|nr:hypothetical protein BGZ65_007584 [Modicella reniformis]
MAPDKPSIRVAVLVCGAPAPVVAEKYGEYPFMFKNLLQLGLDHLKEQNAIDKDTVLISEGFDVRDSDSGPVYPKNPYDWDAILITGSAADVFDDIPWIKQLVKYVKELSTDNKAPKVVGICFGHQVIGKAFNLDVGRHDQGWELGWSKTDLTKAGQEFWQDTHMRIQQLHRDAVFGVPEGFTLLASTAHTENQSMISNDRRIVSVQGHPEFTGDIVKKIIEVRTVDGIFSKELSEASMKLVDEPLDRVKIASRIVQFIQEERPL